MATLTDRVFSCRACIDAGKPYARAFELNADGCPKKFPPSIGAQGEAKLLFMALCPRLTDNYVLDWAMGSPQNFLALASNKDQFGRNYLRSYAEEDVLPKESFYRPFIEIAAEAYPGQDFEEVASVSDLYYCAYPPSPPHYDANYIDLPTNSLCANLFLEDLIATVRPKAIITKGNRTMHYFKKLMGKACQYMTAYPLRVAAVSTVLLPVQWKALDGCAREPERSWLMANIRAVDPDAH